MLNFLWDLEKHSLKMSEVSLPLLGFLGSLLGSLGLGSLLTLVILGVLVCVCFSMVSCGCLIGILILWSIDCIGGYRFRKKLFKAVRKRIRVKDQK